MEISWSPPNRDWVKVNVDGASKGNLGKARCGGLIRDETGRWLGGFTSKLGICNALTVELWGVLHGLNLAWELGFRKIILEIDSQVVTFVLNKKTCPFPKIRSLLLDYFVLLRRDWQNQIQHTYKEWNICVDWLANQSLKSDDCFRKLRQPPLELRNLLLGDANGVYMLRLM